MECGSCPLPEEVEELKKGMEQMKETHELVKKIDLSLHGDNKMKITGMVQRVVNIEKTYASHGKTLIFWEDARKFVFRVFSTVAIVGILGLIGWALELNKLLS